MKRLIQKINERREAIYIGCFIGLFLLGGSAFVEPLPKKYPPIEQYLVKVSYYKEVQFSAARPVRMYKTTTYFTTTLDSVGILMNSSPFPEKAVVTIIKVK